MQFMLLFSRQGKLRLQKWYVAHTDKVKKKITRELVTTILARKPKMCSFLEWKDLKVVYKRYVLREHLKSILIFTVWNMRLILYFLLLFCCYFIKIALAFLIYYSQYLNNCSAVAEEGGGRGDSRRLLHGLKILHKTIKQQKRKIVILFQNNVDAQEIQCA